MFTVEYNARRYAGDQSFTSKFGAGLGKFLAEALWKVNLHLDQYCFMEEKELVPTVYPHVGMFGLTIAGNPADLRNMDRIFREMDLPAMDTLVLEFPSTNAEAYVKHVLRICHTMHELVKIQVTLGLSTTPESLPHFWLSYSDSFRAAGITLAVTDQTYECIFPPKPEPFRGSVP